MRFQGLAVSVIGAGRSGLAAAALLKRLGARVLVSEGKTIAARVPRGIAIEEGRHTDRVLDAELIIRSPGVPGHLPILQKARRRGIPVWSEIELASRVIEAKRIVAITGTNGKTTTTSLVRALFKATRQPTVMGGNIGTPLAALTSAISTRTNVVLEVSSYQLEDIERFHPQISAILNITPDHLEHHGTMRAYATAKARLFENQTGRDVCVLNADDAWCRRLAKRCRARRFWFSRRRRLTKGVFYECGEVVVRWGKVRARWKLKTQLPGTHNIENILAAVAMAVSGGVRLPVIRRVLEDFHGVEHRLEHVRTLSGVAYVNDSKGTNVDSTRVALAAFEQPLILIMGGEGKGTPYAPLIPLLRGVRRLLVIGEDTPAILRALGSKVPSERLRTLPNAVRRARQIARAGEVVLLSPACASFDQYKNYEERGKHFKDLVWRLR